MYHLLAICLVLHPQCVDESIQQVLREKNYTEKMYKMQYGDLQEFEQCFTFACPKFLLPSPPPADAPQEDYMKDAMKHQTQVFMDEVKQQKMLPTIRRSVEFFCSVLYMKVFVILLGLLGVYLCVIFSYLKLYTTLPLSKLATFMSQSQRTGDSSKMDLNKEMAALGIHLLCFKHKMKNVVWTKGASGLDGKFQSGSEVRK